MTRFLALLAGALLVASAFLVRLADGPPPEPVGGDDSWARLRHAELALAAARAPRTDPFLAFPSSAPLPWTATYPSLVAWLARRTAPPGSRDASLRDVEEPHLEDTAARLSVIGGGLAAALAFSIALAASRGLGRWIGACAAAGAYAFFVPNVVRESAATVDPHGIAAVFALLHLAALGRAFRAREMTDVTVAALGAGLFAGATWLVSAGGALGVLFGLGALALRAGRPATGARADGLRALLLYAASAGTVIALAEPRLGALLGGGLAPRIPSPADVAGAVAAVVCAVGWARGADGAERAIWPALVGLAGAAALVDERFHPIFAAVGAVAIGLAAGDRWGSERPGTLATVAFVVTGAAVGVGRPWEGRTEAEAERAVAFARGLRWMRDHTPSAGPFNSVAARPDWAVWCAPGTGGAVAYLARRPVAGDELARELAGAPDAEALARLAWIRGVRYVVTSPRAIGDDADGWLARFALPEPDAALDHVPGFELAYQTAAWETVAGRAGPVLCVYRLLPRRAPAEGARMAPAGD